MKIKRTLYFLLLLLLINCKQNNKIEYQINDLINKFPQLKLKNGEHYSLVRSVKNGEYNFEILLFSKPESSSRSGQILIYSKNGILKAIPLFSNTHRDYWNFEFDTPLKQIKRTNTTFEKELNSIIKNAGKDEKRVIINEIFKSMFHTNSLNNKSDLENFKNTVYTYCDNELLGENVDSTQSRISNNYNELIKNWDKQNYSVFSIYEFDENNHRMYQIIYNSDVETLQIKIFRFDTVTSCME